MQITTIGFDPAKNVFQVHGIDATEKAIVRKPLRRGQVIKFFAGLSPCLVGMEACASALLGARTDAAGARGPFDAGERRESLREAQQERRGRRGGDMRGG